MWLRQQRLPDPRTTVVRARLCCKQAFIPYVDPLFFLYSGIHRLNQPIRNPTFKTVRKARTSRPRADRCSNAVDYHKISDFGRTGTCFPALRLLLLPGLVWHALPVDLWSARICCGCGLGLLFLLAKDSGGRPQSKRTRARLVNTEEATGWERTFELHKRSSVEMQWESGFLYFTAVVFTIACARMYLRLMAIRESFDIATRSPVLLACSGIGSLVISDTILVHWALLIEGKGLTCRKKFWVSYFCESLVFTSSPPLVLQILIFSTTVTSTWQHRRT